MVKDQKKRLGTAGDVADILSHPWFKDIDFKKLEAKEVKYKMIQKYIRFY